MSIHVPAFGLAPLPSKGYWRKLDAGLAAMASLLLATYVVTSFTVARPEDGFHLLLDGYLSNVVMLLIMVSAGLRAALAARLRGPHCALALAIACWTAGDLLWTTVVRNLDPEPWPSVADAFYLGFYPLAVVALIAFMRHQAGTARLGLWLDGLVGGLAMAALGSALFLQPIIEATSGSPTAIAVTLAYPLADLLLLLLVVGGIIIIGRIGLVVDHARAGPVRFRLG